MERKGNSSFAVQWSQDETLDVHADQLKPWKEEIEDGNGIPLYYHQENAKENLPMKVEVIRSHRLTSNGYEFLTHWQGSPSMADTWEPAATFINVRDHVWQQYCQDQRIEVCVPFTIVNGQP